MTHCNQLVCTDTDIVSPVSSFFPLNMDPKVSDFLEIFQVFSTTRRPCLTEIIFRFFIWYSFGPLLLLAPLVSVP